MITYMIIQIKILNENINEYENQIGTYMIIQIRILNENIYDNPDNNEYKKIFTNS